MESIKVDRHLIAVSHLDKILFAPSKISKGDLINYYLKIAPYLIPYAKDHPLTMVRYPEGIKGEGFYQKDAPDYFPKWIKRIEVKKKDEGITHYVVCNNAATLVYLANQNCITPHLWLSKVDALDYPDRMIFDIDPSTKDFTLVRQTAWLVRETLEYLGLGCFVMTTGSNGLHVVVPLNRRASFEQVRNFAHSLAEYLAAEFPEMITIELSKKKRGKKVFLDYLRNGFGATAVCPYAVRPKPGAPVATPLAWDELKDKKLTSQEYNIKNIFKRLDTYEDPWQDFFQKKYGIAKAVQKLIDLLKS